MTNRNIGKFRICSDFIMSYPEQVAEVLAMLKVVPIHCDHIIWHKAFEYVAISERFSEVPHGEVIPEYSLEITKDEDGNVAHVEVRPYR